MRILRGLTSRLLPCGCLAGIYETYDGTVVTLLDDRDPTCTAADHVAGNEMPELGPPRDSRSSAHTVPHGKS